MGCPRGLHGPKQPAIGLLPRGIHLSPPDEPGLRQRAQLRGHARAGQLQRGAARQRRRVELPIQAAQRRPHHLPQPERQQQRVPGRPERPQPPEPGLRHEHHFIRVPQMGRLQHLRPLRQERHAHDPAQRPLRVCQSGHDRRTQRIRPGGPRHLLQQLCGTRLRALAQNHGQAHRGRQGEVPPGHLQR